jgi:PhnB protein
MAIEGSVPAVGAIVPHLVVSDAAAAVEFYERAFAAEVLYRSPSPSGHGEHIHLKVWSALIQVSTEEAEYRRSKLQGPLLASPETLQGSACVFQVRVPDVDTAYERAIKYGGLPAMPPTDMFWGDRYGWICDPFGHMWALSEVKEVLTPEQAAERLRNFSAQFKGQQ